MIKLAKLFFVLLTVTVFAGVVFGSPVDAQTGFEACPPGVESEVCDNKNQQAEGFASNLIKTLLFILGVISVIMIIASGIMYVTSAGSPDKIKKAQGALTYSVVGLAVAILAYAIVNFVLSRFG